MWLAGQAWDYCLGKPGFWPIPSGEAGECQGPEVLLAFMVSQGLPQAAMRSTWVAPGGTGLLSPARGRSQERSGTYSHTQAHPGWNQTTGDGACSLMVLGQERPRRGPQGLVRARCRV